jgi:hypothetical protein
MHLSKQLAILLAVLMLVLIGITAYSLYQVQDLKNTVTQASQASEIPAPSVFYDYGSIKSIGNDSLVITDAQGNDTPIAINNSTSIVVSEPKSVQDYNNEITQYNAELARLRANNDQAGINALTFPSGVTTQPIQFLGLAVGDSLVVTCSGQQSAGTCEATQVMKSQPPSTTPSAPAQ